MAKWHWDAQTWTKPMIKSGPLRPYIFEEAISAREVATAMRRHISTIIKLAHREKIGRVIGRDMMLSRVALQFYLEGDEELLAAYLVGDRESAPIRDMYARLNIPLPASQLAAVG